MLGWDRRPAARASRSKRSRISWLSKPPRRNLIGTDRSSAGSRARYTSPMPPLSMKRSIVYLPMASGNEGGNRNSPRASRAPGRATPAAADIVQEGTDADGRGDAVRFAARQRYQGDGWIHRASIDAHVSGSASSAIGPLKEFVMSAVRPGRLLS